jgi:hypothetical protein
MLKFVATLGLIALTWLASFATAVAQDGNRMQIQTDQIGREMRQRFLERQEQRSAPASTVAPVAPAAVPAASPAAGIALEQTRVRRATARLQPGFAERDGMRSWQHVGGDPYRCRECTPEWAIRNSGWSASVQEALIEAVRRGPTLRTDTAELYAGQFLDFVTFGQNGPKVWQDVRAAWRPDQRETADRYTVLVGGETYHLYRVHACNNWAGRRGVFRLSCPPSVCGRRS